MTQFTDLGLAKPLLKALAAEGYTTPTPIQAKAIPSVLAGRDLLGIAQTGTGKTAAFALPILQRLAENRRPAPRHGARCLVLSPTRELASQIADSFRAYGAYQSLTVAVVFGGASYGPQIKALTAGVDVLVATPGRLIDHIAERHADLSATEILVLDEADQMLDLGFLQPIRRIVSGMPKKRQNLFFSATMPGEIGKLAADLLVNPVEVRVTPSATTVEKVKQQILYIESQRKRALLAELFEDGSITRALVFTRTKRGADRVAKYLEQAGVEAAAIHGDKSQPQRERALAAFKSGQVRALIATDIAARGIDVDAVSHVIQFELPNVPEAYVHRIGRTARAGAAGVAIGFCADDERNLLRDIQKVTRQTIDTFDRRNDRRLGAITAAMGAATPTVAAPRPETSHHRGPKPHNHRPNGHQGPSRNRRRRRGGSGRPAVLNA
ncbi:MAG TPA: DEAD/DEAH box helicase [Caulobacteraceae bacterium]|nr:DEAD/DEAH box helicase [Caulobacteraceae bacterium]